MVLCIVQEHYNLLSSMAAPLPQELQERPKGISIEHAALFLKNELAITQAHSAEEPNALSGRMMEQYRVFHFGWHPHPTSRTILLEMNLIQRPDIDVIPIQKSSDFFLNSF
jgi:hypothetical protein